VKVVEVKNLTKRFDQVTAVGNVSFEVNKGRITSLLGPSGCGKTTTLRLIAGFETPDEGTVLISGNDMRGRRPYERNVGLLFQDYALFPHMTVEQNVAYGLRHRDFDRKGIPRRTAEMLALVKLTGYEKRRPSQLSGGEQQRVALARALATNPEVMLLDEPLSALDAKLRQELRVELKEILLTVGTTTIVVTHDQEEAMSLAEHVIVMDRGRIMQRGSPTQIYARPSNKFVAAFIGRSNWFEGRLGPEDAAGGRRFETTEGFTLRVPPPDERMSDAYEVCVRPERIAIVDGGESEAAGADPRLNTLPATVIDAAPLGADVHVFVSLGSGRRISVIEKNLGQPMRQAGQAVTLRFGADDCIVVPSRRW
jgi:putative spermidine/putrescine transport system ATP-binding protein/putrescine transport system ATP-binding protein